VSSILADERIAAVTDVDLAFAIQHALEEATQRKLALFLFTYSYSLFQTIIRYQSEREKRLLADLSILRQGYRKKEIANVGFVRSEYMIADPMTKICRNALLDEAMRTGKLDHLVAEYIVPEDRSVDIRILYAGLVGICFVCFLSQLRDMHSIACLCFCFFCFILHTLRCRPVGTVMRLEPA
jgi:hypothetical protein